jgi:predicted ArsR family transcriptional regulator
MPPGAEKSATCRQDEVLREIKSSGPLPVRPLAEKLGLSYMGAKSHCLALEKKGLLASRNTHRGPGRPLLVYALTRRGQAWFEENDNAAAISILRHAQNLFGPASAGKLLFLHFQERLEKYRASIPANLPIPEKMERLAALRDTDGHMASLEIGIRIVERHNPHVALHKAFPEADTLEESLFRQILGVPVRRKIQILGDQYEIQHELHTPLSQRPA